MPVETEDKNFKELLQKYKAGQCTAEEIAWLESWYLHWNEQDKAALSKVELDEAKPILWNSIQEQTRTKSILRLWPRYAVVASIVLVFGIWFYASRHPDAGQDPGHAIYANDIAPGTSKATLTLANGKIINLSNTKTGVVIDASKLIYSDGSEVVGEVRVSSRTESLGSLKEEQSLRGSSRDPLTSANDAFAMNTKFITASTPRGGTYQVILPEGTHIWLNAGSTLKFPETFAGLKERKVILTGEAYFVVKHNAAQPFRVQTGDQIVEDIGTEFNINSYADETTTKTTLIEGSARVTYNSKAGILKQVQDDAMLKPGQQSILQNNHLAVSKANLEEAMAWKNGYFRFNDEKIESIMRKISRWYNIEVQYAGEVTAEGFTGTISRNKNISQVLVMLEQTKGVHFKIKGRRILVMQ